MCSKDARNNLKKYYMKNIWQKVIKKSSKQFINNIKYSALMIIKKVNVSLRFSKNNLKIVSILYFSGIINLFLNN